MLLVKHKDGSVLHEEIWFDGGQFVGLCDVIERTRLMPGDLGPDVDGGIFLRRPKRKPLVRWDKLRAGLVSAKYMGPVRATLLVSGSGCLFLSWKLSMDAKCGLFSLLNTGPSAWLGNGFDSVIEESFAVGAQISIAPFMSNGAPIIHAGEGVYLRDVKQGIRSIECAGTSGVIGTAVGVDNTGPSAKVKLDLAIGSLSVAAESYYRNDIGDLISLHTDIARRFVR
jgi:hypothetical protein